MNLYDIRYDAISCDCMLIRTTPLSPIARPGQNDSASQACGSKMGMDSAVVWDLHLDGAVQAILVLFGVATI